MDLYRTPTNSGGERGVRRIFGFSGSNYLIPVFGLFASFLLTINLFGVSPVFLSEADWYVKVLTGLAPFCLAALYTVVMIEGRPPHYQDDVFDALTSVRGLNCCPCRSRPFPHPVKGLRTGRRIPRVVKMKDNADT